MISRYKSVYYIRKLKRYNIYLSIIVKRDESNTNLDIKLKAKAQNGINYKNINIF